MVVKYGNMFLWYNRGMEYMYRTDTLEIIARKYATIYQGLRDWRTEMYDPESIIELKVDFDRALNSIGRGKWSGKIDDWGDFKNYGRLQQIIIADIFGIEDEELIGFKDIPRLRGYAYSLMARFLNG